MATQAFIIPPTGDGIPCTCSSGPKKDGKTISHHHGEFMHLLPRFRHNRRVRSGLGTLEQRGKEPLEA